MRPEEPPQLIGFDDNAHPLTTAERVADLLHAARAAILPSPRAPELPPVGDCEENTTLDQISRRLALIADTLRSSADFDRIALAAALDAVRDMLGKASAAGLPREKSAGRQRFAAVALD